MDINPFVWHVFASGVISGALAACVWRYRTAAGSRSFALLMAAVTVWSFAYTVELASAHPMTTLFALRIEYIGIVTARPLSHLGYRLLTATDGPTAIRLFGQHADSIARVLLDLKMPRMDEPATLEKLRAISPHVVVVLSSGYGKQEIGQRYAHLRVVGCIRKPYDLQELQSVIQQALALPRAARKLSVPVQLSTVDAAPGER